MVDLELATFVSKYPSVLHEMQIYHLHWDFSIKEKRCNDIYLFSQVLMYLPTDIRYVMQTFFGAFSIKLPHILILSTTTVSLDLKLCTIYFVLLVS